MYLVGVRLKAFRHFFRTASQVLLGLLRWMVMTCRSRSAVEAENLFLRKPLALFQRRKNKALRADDSTRWLISFLSRWFDWRSTLVVVKPETLIRWHRKGFRLFWGWKSLPVGRPSLPKDIQVLIRQMARENPSWGEEHIANELNLKLGIRVSPRTVGKYLAKVPAESPTPGQRWLTFVRDHAQATREGLPPVLAYRPRALRLYRSCLIAKHSEFWLPTRISVQNRYKNTYP